MCYYSYVTRSEVDLRLIDFRVTCMTFNASYDPLTYANKRRLKVTKKFSKVADNDFQQPFHGDLRYGRVPGLFAWKGVGSKEAKSFNLNKLSCESVNSFFSCDASIHFRALASPISFLQHSLFLVATFDFLAWSKLTVSLQTLSSYLLLGFPTGLLPKRPSIGFFGGRGFQFSQLINLLATDFFFSNFSTSCI